MAQITLLLLELPNNSVCLPVFLVFVFTLRQCGSRINVEEVRLGNTACTVCPCAAQINSRAEAKFVIVIIIIRAALASASPFGVQRCTIDNRGAEQCLEPGQDQEGAGGSFVNLYVLLFKQIASPRTLQRPKTIRFRCSELRLRRGPWWRFELS